VTAMAAARPWPLALAVYNPGITGVTSTTPVVTVPSPLVTVNVAVPGLAAVGIR